MSASLALVYLVMACLAGILLAAAWRDLAVRMIPNSLSLGALVAGVALRAQSGIEGLAGSLFGAGFVFLLFFLAWLAGGMGGADVKLGSAVAVGLPLSALPSYVLATSVIGLLVALPFFFIGRRGDRSPVVPAGRGAGLVARVSRAERRRLRRRGPVPYVIAIALGGILTHALVAMPGP